MRNDEKVNEMEKERKPYQKPELNSEELFEATVLACGKNNTGSWECRGGFGTS